MKAQFESGNIKKICPDFPDNVKSIQYLHNGYSFCNKGPDSSILETAEKICDKIKNFEFDGVVVSAGAYSSLIYDYVVNTLKKDCYTIGSDLPVYFGIITKRITTFYPKQINEYFIAVPDDMKPEGYEKIEGGSYW